MIGGGGSPLPEGAGKKRGKPRVVIMADMQSFYASVEKASRPEYANRPVVVAGDPKLRSGIVLAACPLAKRRGVTTAERLGEAMNKCADLVVLRPRMQTYINVSMQITRILERYADAVEPFSIDEQFCELTGSLHLHGELKQTALRIQRDISEKTGVFARIGISDNKVLAKMACDQFAKKNAEGVFHLPQALVQENLWPLPVQGLFGVGSRMMRHLNRMGIYTIGDLARTPLDALKRRWGINGEVLWRIANGIDDSPVTPGTHDGAQQAIGHGMTLPRDYGDKRDIETVLLELSEEVCRRCRFRGVMGRVLSVGCTGGGFEFGFSRQTTLLQPTHVTNHVYRAAVGLFHQFWNGQPVRQLYIALGGLVRDDVYQLEFDDERETYRALELATDEIKDRFGVSAIVRAVSAGSGGQAYGRAAKIGGHYK
ncbi:DNA polymerase IV [Paenibacillus alkalitolerans]|uniref:DNA polymerase IV n=1 Tax=Paenibacillus alkalitolerans TaxID=2799335 RepID=UPI0018F306DD|nr:DNA polymerase IV [Paenibacillus alkalitolerans]